MRELNLSAEQRLQMAALCDAISTLNDPEFASESLAWVLDAGRADEPFSFDGIAASLKLDASRLRWKLLEHLVADSPLPFIRGSNLVDIRAVMAELGNRRCPAGHELNEANVFVSFDPHGRDESKAQARCRICNRADSSRRSHLARARMTTDA